MKQNARPVEQSPIDSENDSHQIGVLNDFIYEAQIPAIYERRKILKL